MLRCIYCVRTKLLRAGRSWVKAKCKRFSEVTGTPELSTLERRKTGLHRHQMGVSHWGLKM